jgi:hypothetical protein
MTEAQKAVATLPFEAAIIGYLSAANYSYVAVARDHAMHPFVVYSITPSGHCESGDYVATRTEAFVELNRRVMHHLR